MLARSNLIYVVICHRRGNRKEAVEAGSLPQLWGYVDGVTKPSVRTDKLLFLYFRFVLIGEKVKNKWSKTDERTKFGVP